MIDEWFSTKIYYNFIDNFKEKNKFLKKRAYDIRDKIGANVVTEWSCDTFNTLNYDYVLNNDDDINVKNFVQEIGVEVFNYIIEVYNIKPDSYYLECNDFWFNISEPGNYQEYHQHNNCHFSVVYYVKAPEKSGNIIFKSLNSLFETFALPFQDELRTCKYKPQEGKILIFKSNQLHMVEKNNSNEDRISIAANFTVKKA